MLKGHYEICRMLTLKLRFNVLSFRLWIYDTMVYSALIIKSNSRPDILVFLLLEGFNFIFKSKY